ncbi:nucleotide-binding protein [Gordonia rubripertincta]|uniref:Wzz/FepE/Etk N-terminal domain-containing protein n=1 Tax=Gordonia rubripertincta TaxID=36822 RepID=A0ABT4MXR0_GORRU|nr:Wzz/FepE/Etk N-terminal domain-containing protein [Gordonia rubripertincta]MCZ4551777.1 Wzz/FepE/Etk N-terminal domain-containing protein [Gordonia rubripertincta]
MSSNQRGIAYRPDNVGSEWLRSAIGALRSSWIIVLACVVVGGALGLILTTQQAPAYESSAVIYQTPRTSDSESTSRQRTEAFTELLTSDRLISTALADSGIQMTVSQVRDATTVGANEGSAILTVTVRTDDADESAALANALAEALPPTVAALDGEQANAPAGQDPASPTRLSLVTPATPENSGVGRNYGRNIALGIVAGLLVGLLYSYLRAQLSRRVQGDVALGSFLSGPVVASIPADKTLSESGLVDFRGSGGAAEAFRRLRTLITGEQPGDHDYRTIVVTSATDGDGKTTTAINLAVALAEAGSDVVFVDAALASGAQGADRAGDGATEGLSDYLRTQRDIGEFPSASWQSRLWVIRGGSPADSPSELLATSRMRAGLSDLATRTDYVIVDSTSLGTSSDAIVLARAADGVLVVARSNRTRYNDLSDALERLALADVPVAGVVLNGYPRATSKSGRSGSAGLSVDRLLAGSPIAENSAGGKFLPTGGGGRRRAAQPPSED